MGSKQLPAIIDDVNSEDKTLVLLAVLNLSNADLSGATVTNATFGAGIGLSDEVRNDLVKRGAIFDAEPKEQKSSPQH